MPEEVRTVEKHGFDFLQADELFDWPHVIVPTGRSEPEERFLAIGKVAGRWATVVHTFREGDCRLISMGSARDAERRSYQDLLRWLRSGPCAAAARIAPIGVDAMTGAELERAIAEDEDERDLEPDWTRAQLIMPQPRQSVHLRLDREVIDFFKAGGKGHITHMQAVLRAYADAHKRRAGDHRRTRAEGLPGAARSAQKSPDPVSSIGRRARSGRRDGSGVAVAKLPDGGNSEISTT